MKKVLKYRKKIFSRQRKLSHCFRYMGASLFDNFFAANEWIYNFFPNHAVKTHTAKEPSFTPVKKIIEWLLNNKQGNKADTALMHYFDKRWKKLIARNKFTESGFQLGSMMADKHFCRPYP